MNKRPVHAEVRLKKGESPTKLIKRFMKKVKKSGVIESFLDKRYHKKGSQLRQEKRKRRKWVLDKLKKERERESK